MARELGDQDGKYFMFNEKGENLNKDGFRTLSAHGETFDADVRLSAVLREDGSMFVVNEKGESVVGDRSFRSIGTDFKNIDGKTFFAAQEERAAGQSRTRGGWFVFDENGNRVSEEFDKIYDFGKGFIWGKRGDKIIKISFEIPDENVMTDEEKKKLDLLNLVNTPESAEKIGEYFSEESKMKEEYKKESGVGRLMSKIIPGMAKIIPRFFAESVASKRDRLTNILAVKTAKKIFPEAYEEKPPRDFAGYFGFREDDKARGYDSKELSSPEEYLRPNNFDSFVGGDPRGESVDGDDEVVRLRESTSEMLSTGLYGEYSEENGTWKKVYFPVNAEVGEYSEEKTATLPNVKGLAEVILPKPVNAKIIIERVKGVGRNGEEINLEVGINSLNEAVAVVPPNKKTKEVIYSFKQNLAPEKIPEIGRDEYKKFRESFSGKFGKGMEVRLTVLPDDIKVFIEQIWDKPPKEQLILTERFVRDLSYYDFDNAEVIKLKAGKSIEEQIYIMEQRMEELKKNDWELEEKLKNKKFAGVCADFAVLTTAILRELGFVSGVESGFVPSGKRAGTRNAHGRSFTVWPDGGGKTKIISVDGTPGGIDAEQQAMMTAAGIIAPSLAEKEKISDIEDEKLRKLAEKDLEKIVKISEGMDVEAIRQLTNGRLENVLNILVKKVRVSNVKALEGVLSAYWYTPAKDLDLKNAGQKAEFIGFLEAAVANARKAAEKNGAVLEKPAGAYLFEMLDDFTRRFIKGEKTKNQSEAFDLLEEVIDLNKHNFSDIERKSAAAIITYLRAKKMKGEGE